MSHFVRIQTVIREDEILRESLRALGYSFDEGESLPVRGDARSSETAQIVVRTGTGYDVGFRRSGEAYEIVADWYRVEQGTPLRRQAFIDEVTRQYSVLVVRAQAREQNLVIEEETVDEEGRIVITLSERG